jgi:hypothetical protein
MYDSYGFQDTREVKMDQHPKSGFFYFKIDYDSFSFIRFLMNFLYDLFKQIWLRSYGFWGKREYFLKGANTKTYSNSILLTVFIGSKNYVMDLLSSLFSVDTMVSNSKP